MVHVRQNWWEGWVNFAFQHCKHVVLVYYYEGVEWIEQEIVQGMEDFDDVVDWVVWMLLICKKDVVEELENNMDDMFVQEYVEDYSCNHKMNHAKLVDKIGEGYIVIDMAALTQEYSIMDYASKKMEMKCFQTYMQAMVSMVSSLYILDLLDTLFSSQVRKRNYPWDTPFGNEEKTLIQIMSDFS